MNLSHLLSENNSFVGEVKILYIKGLPGVMPSWIYGGECFALGRTNLNTTAKKYNRYFVTNERFLTRMKFNFNDLSQDYHVPTFKVRFRHITFFYALFFFGFGFRQDSRRYN